MCVCVCLCVCVCDRLIKLKSFSGARVVSGVFELNGSW